MVCNATFTKCVLHNTDRHTYCTILDYVIVSHNWLLFYFDVGTPTPHSLNGCKNWLQLHKEPEVCLLLCRPWSRLHTASMRLIHWGLWESFVSENSLVLDKMEKSEWPKTGWYFSTSHQENVIWLPELISCPLLSRLVSICVPSTMLCCSFFCIFWAFWCLCYR